MQTLWYLFAIALILILAVTGASLARPYITKIGIDKCMTGHSDGTMSEPKKPARDLVPRRIVFVLIIVEFVFNYLQHYILECRKEDNKGYKAEGFQVMCNIYPCHILIKWLLVVL